MLKKLKLLYELGVDKHLNTYELLKLQIVNRLTVLCILLDFVLMILNIFIANYTGLIIDILALVFVLTPVLLLNHYKRYLVARYLFVIGYHTAVLVGSWQAVVEGRVNEIELLLVPGAIGLTILFRGPGQVIFYVLNMAALAYIKYWRWGALEFVPNDYYKLMAVVFITYTGVYYFVIQFKTQLMQALQNSEFLNDALMRNEKELKESNSAKDRLFSIVAHDLKSPLNLIKGLLDPAVLVDLEKDELMKHQTTLRSRIAVLQETMNNLLSWAQTQLGRLKTHPVEVDVSNELKSIIELFGEMIQAKEVNIQYSNNHGFNILVDKNHFNVIMRNIVHNAIKFTPKQSGITVEVTRDHQMICMAVVDSGAGIREETKDKILKSQLLESAIGTEGERGSGIGLSFSHELIKKNGGTLDILSPELGGARLEVRLPAGNIDAEN